MRADPFATEDAIARERFVSDLSEMVRDNPAMAHVTATSGSGQISAFMTEARRRDTESRKALYDRDRIGDQLDWFQRKARSNERLAARWFASLVALQCLAVCFAMAGFLFPAGQRWPVGILTSAAAAVMAWIQAKQFREHAASYSVAAHALSLLRSKVPDIATDEKLAAFVDETEANLSRELARWQRTRGGEK